MTPPVNDLHARLRDQEIETAIATVRFEITMRGHDVVKRDPGVYAWVMENARVLGPLARTGGLGGARKH